MKKLVTFLASTVAGATFAADLSVTEPTTLSATADYHNAAIHADLAIDGQASVAITGDVVSVGSEYGESPVVRISGKGSLLVQHLKEGGNSGNSAHWLWPAFVIGENGGSAKFEVSDSAGTGHTNTQRPTTGLGLWLGGVTVASAAEANNLATETIDLLELKSGGWADIAAVTNLSGSTVRLLFNGGSLRMHYAGTRNSISYYAPTGKTIELASVGGNDIYIDKRYLGVRFISGGGTLKTSGAGAFVLSEAGYTEGSNKTRTILSADQGSYVWGHAGEFRLETGGVLELGADNMLPYGAQTGIVRLKGTNEQIFPEIDMHGKSAKVNGLVTTGAAFVSNRVATVGTIVLGDSGYDRSRLSAKIRGNVVVKMRGTGDITVDNTEAPAADIESGRVTVTGDTFIGAVSVGAAAQLIVDGATLACTSFACEDPESVSCVNGGRIVYRADVGAGTKHVWEGPDRSGIVEKTGAGEYVLHDTAAFGGTLRVLDGRWTFSGCGSCTNEWWRWTVTASFGGSVAEIGELCFFHPTMAGTARMTNPSYYEYNMAPVAESTTLIRGSDATVMPNSSVMVPEGDAYGWKTGGSGRVYGDPIGLFDLNSVNKMFSPTLALPKAQTAAYPITVRLAKNKSVGYFSYCNSTFGLYAMPKGWTLETSPDGVNWTTVTTFYDSTNTPTEDMLTANGFVNRGNVFRFEQLTMDQSVGLTTSASVEVAAGATLDLDHTPEENAAIRTLVYDAAIGAGTITTFNPAPNGALRLMGLVPSYDGTELGYSFGKTVNAANLESWKVYVNGVETAGSVALVDGKLVVARTRRGMVLLVK